MLIYLLLGKDDYSKKEFLKDLAVKEQASGIDYFYEWQPQAVLQSLQSAGLFDKRRIVAVFEQLGKFDFEEFAGQLGGSQNTLVFVENALDRRKTETKKILANKIIKTVEFEIPRDADLRKWVENYSKKIGLEFAPGAVNLFLERIASGSSDRIEYDLWQVSSELNKFKAFAGSEKISAADLQNLAVENIEEDVFKITNAIADKNKKAAIQSLVDYLDRLPGNDEKSKIISLSAILAEQLRGILIIQNFLAGNTADPEMLKQTGYSPGKLFIYKKIAKGFKPQKILEALSKIELLDQEMKTSNGPAALQFLMIVNSVMN